MRMLLLAALALSTAILVEAGLRLALPWLRRLALARPNARSSHTVPTPQGAGVIVVPVALAGALVATLAGAPLPSGGGLHALAVAGAALLLTAVGFVDDSRGLGVAPRLAAQVVAVAVVLLTLPETLRVLPALPLLAERALLALALLWFINLFNFMDGMDLMSVTEAFALLAGLLLLALLGRAPVALAWWSAALIGAVSGFARWNAPPARIFLGDAGSLPLGLLLAVMLMHPAAGGGPSFAPGALAAALILPLYYLLDASVTLARRIARRERVWQAHRQHFYQQALACGRGVPVIIAAVAALNLMLIVLALVASGGGAAEIAFALAAAVLLTGAALWTAARG